MQIPTVRVKHPDLEGGMLINESDYSPYDHEPFDEASAVRCEALAEATRAKHASWHSETAMAADPGNHVVVEQFEARAVGDGFTGESGEGTGLQPATDPTDPAPKIAAVEARRAELTALPFVELKETVADLGIPIVPVGTSKADLVEQILLLEGAAAAAALGAQS